MAQVEHIEFYHPKHIKSEELEVLRDRVKKFHFYQFASEEEFDEANKPQLLKLENNKYFKKFNLIAN